MTTDERYMQRCLQLAALGTGQVSTNPLVGCVVVHENKIIGEGYHRRFGEAHAEVNAINSVKDAALLSNSTLYVSLEPCTHFGKTPPCSNLIIEQQLKRVVIGSVDTNNTVGGHGVERLKEAGIAVTTGILESECRWLNRRFFCYHEKKRPYIILKWVQTSNGYMGRLPQENHLDKKISNAETDILVHRWRSEEDAILVGKNTALQDNPSLTTRLWKGKNPKRVLIDPNLETPVDYSVFNNQADTIVFNGLKQGAEGNIEFEKIEFAENSLMQILTRLHEKQIQSVLVEGGRETLQQFIGAGLWDEARMITSEKVWENGIAAPLIAGKVMEKQKIRTDIVTYYIHE